MENFTLNLNRLEIVNGKMNIIFDVIVNGVKLGEGSIDNTELHQKLILKQTDIINNQILKTKLAEL